MSGYKEWNFPAFYANSDYMRSLGWDVINPAELDKNVGFDPKIATEEFTEQHFKDAMKRDYRAILDCDAIAFMPGWEKSRGARLERDFASRLGLPMYRVDVASSYFEQEKIIGIAGFAQSGKDLLAGHFVANHGFERVAFADTLRGMLYETNPIVALVYEDRFREVTRVQSVVDAIGWEGAKSEYPEIRELLQRLGTEAGRKHIADDIWSRTVFERPHLAKLVIPDVRFPNEAKAIQDRGGVIIRVKRDGYEPINGHISETAYDGFDIVLENNGAPEELFASAESALGWGNGN